MISNLHYISQASPHTSHEEHILAACEAGCNWIQLRIKQASEADILPVAFRVKKICDRYHAALIINDYPYIAVAVGAAGVHVGKNDMTVAEARRITGPHLLVGGTANTAADIIQHAQDGADYVGLGPFRFTTTKEQLSPILGLTGYMAIMQQLQLQNINIPVIAIGGILIPDIAPILQTGIHGIAASALITHASDKAATVQHIFQQLNPATTCNH
jgi:thiamine-phosphate pyrophosphorylase